MNLQKFRTRPNPIVIIDGEKLRGSLKITFEEGRYLQRYGSQTNISAVHDPEKNTITITAEETITEKKDFALDGIRAGKLKAKNIVSGIDIQDGNRTDSQTAEITITYPPGTNIDYQNCNERSGIYPAKEEIVIITSNKAEK